MKKQLLEKILSEVSLDHRVGDGIFNIEEDSHMEALRDYLTKKGIDEESVKEFSNKVLEGKYPERQAYNAKGILVTFPTPEYKQAAIKRGTHFEDDPTRKASNIFSEPSAPSSPEEKKPVAEPEKKSKTEPKTNLPVSQAAPPSDAAATTEPSVQAKTTAAPQQTPSSTPAAEPTAKEPNELPLPPQKSPAEKEADKTAIKAMLKGDDYMLDEVVQYVMFNAPPYMIDKIKKLL
jgi:FtsZ-interacting cell division protein ZipA